MVRVVYVLAVLLSPVASGFNALLDHQKAHESGSVRFLKANETVHKSGSDLVFTWARCVICDGYDVRLYLQDISGKQEIPYQLMSAVTVLRVPNVPPRTTYKLVVKRLPETFASSEVSGRSFAPEAPSPVESLDARAVTNSSIQIEWRSKNADGFIARVLKNNTMIQEKVIPEFSKHSIVNITGLKPATSYHVQVSAFFFPPAGKSISSVSTVQVKTLPQRLPKIDLKWRFSPKPELFWENPGFPAPVSHEMTCTQSSVYVLRTRFSGSTDFAILSGVTGSADIHCVLDTWFSREESAKVTSTAVIHKEVKRTPPSSSQTNYHRCRGWSYAATLITTSGAFEKEQFDGLDLLVLKFSYHQPDSMIFVLLKYKICEENGPCEGSYKSSKDYSKVFIKPGDVKPWVSHTVYFYFHLRCSRTSGNSYDNLDLETEVGSFVVPGLLGTVDPVQEITGSSSNVTWKYNSSTTTPDYFLITYCTGDVCTSQSAPGQNRSLFLRELKARHVYFVTIQAVKLWAGKAYVSPMKMTSIVAPRPEFPERVALSATEIANSSTVRLVIAHNVTSDGASAVEYHVAVCSKRVPLWNDTALTELMSTNGTCEFHKTPNSTLDLIREPWTTYEVSVLVCYGAFDFNDPVNLTLPIFKQDPDSPSQLMWNTENAMLTWEYNSWSPTGFSISICSLLRVNSCFDTLVGPLDRQYLVESSDGTDTDGFRAMVTSFVTYEGVNHNGSTVELTLTR